MALELIRDWLADPETGWSIGTFGAIAEFTRDREEPATLTTLPRGGRVTTGRGAIEIALPPDTTLIAHESLAARPDRWGHEVLCVCPDRLARMARRVVVCELGPDPGALGGGDREGVLFDLGVGAPNVDVCVRIREPGLIALLRRHAGGSIFGDAEPAMAAIKAQSPTRVFLSRAGRIEVYQPIGSLADNRPTPEGPHTHLLPDLLASGRTHSANAPVPAGFTPTLNLYPAHPLAELNGHDREFDAGRHRAFQALLKRFAPEGYIAEKARITAAVLDRISPDTYRPAPTRIARRGGRIALRQLAHTHVCTPDLERWRAAFDKPAGPRSHEARR